MIHLSKTVGGILHFRFRFVFIKVYTFFQQNAWTLWLWNVMITFKIKMIEKPHAALLTDLWFLDCNKKFKTQWYLRELELSKNWCKNFLN